MKKPRINNEIRAREVRLIDEEGKNLGVFEVPKALELAKEKQLDVIEISPNVRPPIAKLMDFGKFLYKEKKKARDAAKSMHVTETKDVRIHLGTSEHDLALKAKKASEFLKEGHRLKVELFLKGREKYLDKNFLEERLKRILNLISEDYKISENARKGPRGLFMIIEREK
jgi:translation initiation factor IF-3